MAGLLNQAPIRSHPTRPAVHLVMTRTGPTNRNQDNPEERQSGDGSHPAAPSLTPSSLSGADVTRDPDRDHKQHRHHPVSVPPLGARPHAAQAPPEASRPPLARRPVALDLDSTPTPTATSPSQGGDATDHQHPARSRKKTPVNHTPNRTEPNQPTNHPPTTQKHPKTPSKPPTTTD